jgi:glycine cleavage system H protein
LNTGEYKEKEMDFPNELRYTTEHEWIRDEGGAATIGVTDYAQERLGDVVFVEMPETGTGIRKGEAFGVIESVKAASDVFCPVSGEVVEINQNLEEHPEYVNQSPYGDGWIVRIKMKDPSEMDDLMNVEQYQAFVQQEESK